MQKLLFLLVASLVLVGLATAAPITCTPPPPAQNVLDPGFTYTCGDLTFSEFSAIDAGGVPSPSIYLTGASWDPVTAIASLNFNPNLSGATGTQDVYFFLTVSGASIDQVGLAVGGVDATIIEILCGGAFDPITNACSAPLLPSNFVAFSDPGMTTVWSSVFQPTNPLYIFKDIGVAQGGALSLFTQSFHAVPEPFTFVLFGSGLLVLGVLRRRRA
jgi:hypothetical protein